MSVAERAQIKKEKEKILEKITAIVEPAAKELGMDIVDIEYLQDGGYWYVRVFAEYLDREISLDDCALLSNKIEDDIDKVVDQKFYLEVSSPGIERPLKKIQDFIRFKGEKAKIILKTKIDDIKEYKGKIIDCHDNTLIIDTGEKKEEIEFDKIKKANLLFEFDDI